MANLLDEASILLTPTAYNNGSMLAVKPEIALSEELVVNGDFATADDWSTNTGWTAGGGLASCDGTQSGNTYLTSSSPTALVGKKYYISLVVDSVSSGWATIKVGGVNSNEYISTSGTYIYNITSTNASDIIRVQGNTDFIGTISNVSVKEDLSGDFTFSRNSAATRVNAQGLVENVQILSSNLVSNGDFSQEGSELVNNGNFANGSTDWTISGGNAQISNGKLNLTNAVIYGTSVNNSATVVSGKTYLVKYTISDYVGGSSQIRLGSRFGTSRNSNGTFSEYILANDTAIRIYSSSSNTTLSITNISVKEVGQDWTITDSDANNYVEFGDGTARLKFLNTSPITSFTSDTALFQGGKKYKLTVDVANVTSGSIKIDGSGISELFNTVGVSTRIINPSSNGAIYFYRATANVDVTLNSVSLIEITDDTNLPRINYEGFSYQDSLGSEEVVNGNFATDTNWIKNGQVTIGGGVAYFNSDGTFTQIAQSISGVSGKNVKVVIEITEYTQGTLKVLFSGGTQQNLPNSVGVHTLYFNNADSDTINIARLGGVTNLKIDNVSVKEYLGQEIVPSSGCGHWLMETQSTNLITQSELFSDSSWTKQSGIVLTSNSTISPDGTNNATKVTGNGTVGIYTSAPVTGLVSRSIYIKSVVGNVNVVLKDPTLTVTSKSVLVTENWQRFELVENNGNSSSSGLWVDDIPSSGIYIWGAQLEQSSYATSYIPTQGASSTRLQDIATNSGNASLINSEQGVLYAEISALANDLTNRQISINNGTTDDRIQLYYSSSSNQINIFYKAQSGATVFILSYVLNDIKTFNKVAFKWLENDFALWVNGIKVDTNTSGVTSNANSLTKIDFKQFNNSAPFYGNTKALAVYKTALTDAQLTLLTTI